MIIVDRALARRAAANDPVRVGMVGAGFMGRGIARQILSSVPGMELAAASGRRLHLAAQAYREAGADEVQAVTDVGSLEAAISAGRPAVTEDPSLLCRAQGTTW